MKNLTLRLAFLTIVMLGWSCSSDSNNNDNSGPQRPFNSLFSDTTITDPLKNGFNLNQPSYPEYGYEFSVNKSGKITELGAKIPDYGTARVTLWILEPTPTAIVQKNITLLANIEKYEALETPISLAVGKKYAISIMSNDLFFQYPYDGVTELPYPMTKGNIVIEKYGYHYSPTPEPTVYFDTFPNGNLAGFMDFTFVKD
jgi:hypothetical protein